MHAPPLCPNFSHHFYFLDFPFFILLFKMHVVTRLMPHSSDSVSPEPGRNVNVSFLLAEICSGSVQSRTQRGRRGSPGQGPPGRGERERKKIHIPGDCALLGDYTGFNWRMEESKVVSDISGLGIWQSAVWSHAKSPGLARNC